MSDSENMRQPLPADEPEPTDDVESSVNTAQELGRAAREIDEFADAAGWGQNVQLFALVPTAALLAEQPELADQLDSSAPLTPIAQDELPSQDLQEALAQIAWPPAVLGCAVVQEIVILPTDAQAELESAGQDDDTMARIAAEHPDRREARLTAAVHRDGSGSCVLRLRPVPGATDADEEALADEVVEHPELAPNLIDALRATFAD